MRFKVIVAIWALLTGIPALAAASIEKASGASLAVGPQYDTTHVYVAPADFDHFVASLLATFGGTATKQGIFTVTPTPSKTMSQLVLTPAGSVSVFGFTTPIPYPFGTERNGYLVDDFDKAVAKAHAQGASIIVAPFPDPIGRDALIQWPGGVNMQLYWHTSKPNYPALTTFPDNRVYLAREKADEFISKILRFSHGKVVTDNTSAPGIEIGRPNDKYRSVWIDSPFGKWSVFVTDGQLPYPFGHEMTGYEVADLAATLDKATRSGASVLVAPYASRHRQAAIVQFPGGYIAEIHAANAT